ncbi:MAG: TldD/PmbA family protein [Acidobacteria bacterium]|nr:TldD/PmbA family protein [Acidobacteriota bacterium]
MLPKERCQELFSQILKHSEADETEVLIAGGASELTRFANNTIHQNVAEEGYRLSVRTVFDGKTARATTNKFDAESLKRVVAESSSLARQQPRDPDLLPMPDRESYRAVNRYSETTAAVTPEDRARGVVSAIKIAEKNGQTAAGTFSTTRGGQALLNSRGLCAFYHETHAEFSITTMAPNSSGWAKKDSADVRDISPERLAARAAEIAARSQDPKDLEPGKYVTILEPAAVLDLVGFMFFDFSGQAVRDKRSFLTDRVGEKLFGSNIDIRDDVYHPLQSGPPFDGEGVRRKQVTLVEHGVVKSLTYARKTAKAMGTEPTGHGFPLPNEWGEAPMNIVFEGGKTSVNDMISSTDRGVLVTRVWYIREVDPYRKILTGMTRDGTFYVENGKVKHGIRNFRFNESLIDMLNCVESMGEPERASGEESAPMIVPALKLSSFNFTEVTKF